MTDFLRTISAKPSEIAVGDRVIHYGVLFEITDKTVSAYTGGRVGPERPRYVLATRLLDYPADGSAMPRHWADDWRFQGNDLARFAKVI